MMDCEQLGQACICNREAHAADLTACRCWVLHVALIEALALRWGAHAPACPVYRESADPVDRANDIDLRVLATATAIVEQFTESPEK